MTDIDIIHRKRNTYGTMATDSGNQESLAQVSVVCSPLGTLKTLTAVTLKPFALTSTSFGKFEADISSSTQSKQKQQAFAHNKAYSTENSSCERHSSVNAKWASVDRSYSLDDTKPHRHFLSPAVTLSTAFEETYIDIVTEQYGSCATPESTSESPNMTMTETKTSSNRSTPTMVRSRPPLPTSLTQPGNKPSDNTTDLASALSSFRSTNFVRKYSRKGRSPSSTGSVTPACTPLLSPTGCMSPTPQNGASGLMTSSSASNLAANFGTISMIKTRLEQVAKNQSDHGDETATKEIPLSSDFNKKSELNRENYNLNDSHNDAQSKYSLTDRDPQLTSSAKNARDRFTESLSKPLPDNTFSSQISEIEIYVDIASEEKGGVCPRTESDLRYSPQENAFPLDNANPGKTQINEVKQAEPDPLFSQITLPQEKCSPFESKTISSNETQQHSTKFESPNTTDFKTSKTNIQNRKRALLLKNFSSFDSSEGDSVQSSNQLALSSLESNRGSVDDLCLHLSDNEDEAKSKSRREQSTVPSQETDDEGVGVEMAESQKTYLDVYNDVTNSPIIHRKQSRNKCTAEGKSRIVPIDLAPLQTPLPHSQIKGVQSEDVPQSPRQANGRFLTHPPLTKGPVPEKGSVDSNGLGSLRDSNNPGSSASDLTASITSFDSHFCSGESTDTQMFETVSEGPVSTQMERRNSRQLKQKSKSDPSGGQRIDKSDLTAVVQAHLHKQQPFDTPPFSDRQSPIVVNIIREDEDNNSSLDSLPEQRYIVKPKTALHTIEMHLHPSEDSSSAEDLVVRPRKRSSKRRQKLGTEESVPRQNTSSDIVDSPHANTIPATSQVRATHSSVPATPIGSPDSTLQRNQNSLVPENIANKKRLTLSRSHSTASVLYGKDANNQPSKGGVSMKSPRQGARLDSSKRSLTDWSPTRGRLQIGTFSSILKPIYSSSLSIFEGPEEGKTKRELIVKEFHNTEQQFVEALQIMVEKYMIPMKTQNTFDSSVVDTIFYKINEIYMHHATFLAFLERALASWSDTTTIGDVICKTFSKQTVVESYMLFMDNFPKAEKRLDDISSKSAFQKFTEQVERELSLKLPLKAQIVKPAQRIPRYELLIKRLLENTQEDHADYQYLKQAEKAIHHLALRINSVKESKREEDYQDTLKKLELLLLTDLVNPERQYIRHDMVQVTNRKDDVCLWLFTDLLLFSTVKRKTGPVNRKSSVLLQSPSGHDFVDNTKQRLWLRFSLDDVEIIKTEVCDISQSIDPKTKKQLEEDFSLLSGMLDSSNQLHCKHENLEEILQELISHVNKQLSAMQLKGPPPEANQLSLVASAENGGLHDLTIIFPSLDKKIQWEANFKETKSKMINIRDTKPLEFLQALQITKTRAGMQFTCAAVVEGESGRGFRDVWVCNSDGYVGHMCLLSLYPEPIVTLNTPVPGCNSRILCICAIPPYTAPNKRFSRSNSTISRRSGKSQTVPSITVQDSTDFSEDGYVSDTSTTDTQSDDDMSEDTTAAESCSENQPCSIIESPSPHTPETPLQNPLRSLMWLGTEDGHIHIFPTSENIKTTKCKMKLQQSAAILCIVHVDNRVFVSLASGDLVVYKRDSVGIWDTANAETVSLASASTPINKILAVAGRLWCASYNDIMIVNPVTIETEVTFSGNTDTRRGIQCMATSGQSVCVSGNGSSKVLIFHASNYELLQEISVAQSVVAQLQTVDDIIRQHKIACLRITSLATCRDALWVGTSAGIIVTIPLPKVSSFLARNNINAQPPTITGVPQGHTGHVRFLTCVEMPQCFPSDTTDGETPVCPHRRNSTKLRGFSNRYLIISGGDGLEDSTINRDPETAGKDDSMNHLLLWQM